MSIIKIANEVQEEQEGIVRRVAPTVIGGLMGEQLGRSTADFIPSKEVSQIITEMNEQEDRRKSFEKARKEYNDLLKQRSKMRKERGSDEYKKIIKDIDAKYDEFSKLSDSFGKEKELKKKFDKVQRKRRGPLGAAGLLLSGGGIELNRHLKNREQNKGEVDVDY